MIKTVGKINFKCVIYSEVSTIITYLLTEFKWSCYINVKQSKVLVDSSNKSSSD